MSLYHSTDAQQRTSGSLNLVKLSNKWISRFLKNLTAKPTWGNFFTPVSSFWISKLKWTSSSISPYCLLTICHETLSKSTRFLKTHKLLVTNYLFKLPEWHKRSIQLQPRIEQTDFGLDRETTRLLWKASLNSAIGGKKELEKIWMKLILCGHRGRSKST